jgi:hypothetical protein
VVTGVIAAAAGDAVKDVPRAATAAALAMVSAIRFISIPFLSDVERLFALSIDSADPSDRREYRSEAVGITVNGATAVGEKDDWLAGGAGKCPVGRLRGEVTR